VDTLGINLILTSKDKIYNMRAKRNFSNYHNKTWMKECMYVFTFSLDLEFKLRIYKHLRK